MQQNFCLDCYQFPSPIVILCFYTFTFPTHSLLSQHFTSKDKDTGACTRFQHVQVRIFSEYGLATPVLCLDAQSCPTLLWGFSRQEYWSGLPCPSAGDLPNPGIEPRSPTLQEDSLPAELPGKPLETPQSVQFSHSVMSVSLRPHESQHARPPCPSQTPGIHSDSCPLSQ